MGVVRGGRKEWNKALGEEENVDGLLARSPSIFFVFGFSWFFVVFARLIPISCGSSLPRRGWRGEQSERDPVLQHGIQARTFLAYLTHISRNQGEFIRKHRATSCHLKCN